MYKSFFGLRVAPFGASPDPRFLYMMPQIREALACLQYGIATRKGFVVMTGEVGTGKTTLLKAVLSTFSKNRVSSAFVFNPRLDVLDFLEFVLTDFGIPPTTRTKSGMLLQLNRWLIERYRERGLCVIVVDEAQNCSWELLEEIRLLTNLETSSEKLLQIVLSGQSELAQKLRHPSVRQLRQRVSVWCKTQALTEQETQAYIAERLRIAGASEPVLSPEAVELVHRHSAGIPRLINLICEHAMISAYVEQIKPIPARIIESVSMELDLDQQPFVISPEALSGLSETTVPVSLSSVINPVAASINPLKESDL
ncbi:MAG TPA: AAA family ATPase [Terracidiphilus sp.]|jgi:type II secretory pathway predicted ATPase ExeA